MCKQWRVQNSVNRYSATTKVYVVKMFIIINTIIKLLCVDIYFSYFHSNYPVLMTVKLRPNDSGEK